MPKEEKAASRVGYWILTMVLVMVAAYIYFQK